MARLSRFLLNGPLSGPGEYDLDPPESHHAAHVLRLGIGDAAVVFDGRGNFAEAVVVAAGKGGVRVRVDAVETEPRPPLFLVVAACIPKGKRWQALVEKCTELGVDRIVPLVSDRSVARGEGDADRWRRWTVEAAKQCRRARLPEVSEPMGVGDAAAAAEREGAFLLLADPEGESPRQYAEQMKRALRVTAIIGPEGGFTEGEKAFLKERGARAVTLSPFVLRVETAAAAVCAILRDI